MTGNIQLGLRLLRKPVSSLGAAPVPIAVLQEDPLLPRKYSAEFEEASSDEET